MRKFISAIVLIFILTSCSDVESNKYEKVSDADRIIEVVDSTTVDDEPLTIQEETTMQQVDFVTDSEGTNVSNDLDEEKDHDEVAEDNGKFSTVDDLMDFYFEYGTEGHYSAEISCGFYSLYNDLDFKEFVKECSRYTISIQNRISSYVVYGLQVAEGEVDRLRNDVGALDSVKAYSYFTERLVYDCDLTENVELLLEDDFIKNPGYEVVEAGLAEADTIDDLVKLSFTYTIDGAYAESYSGKVKSIYNSLGLLGFISECCSYGDVIQDDFAMHLAYEMSYFEEDKRVLEEELNNVVRDDNIEFFLTSLEKYLSSW